MSNTDQLNRLLANIIQFETGEILKAEKLNALIEIFDENLNHIGGAIGDIYDENFQEGFRNKWGHQFTQNLPADGAVDRRLDIANIGRIIGPASNLNPQLLGSASITETIPAGTTEYVLKYPILGALNISDYIVSNDFTTDSQYKIINQRLIIFSAPLATDKEVTYVTSPTLYAGGPNYSNARFNVYPDPNQNDPKLNIIYSAGNDTNTPTYTIALPTVSRQQISLADKTTSELDSSEANHEAQLLLPQWIDELANNTELPKYSLYLKNYTTNESYVSATYTKVSDTVILVTGLNIGNQECVNAFDLRIITVGTDITTSIDDLRNKLFLHKHDGSFGEPLVNINNLAGVFEAIPPSGVYGPSENAWNPLPAYLHRDGWQEDDAEDINGQNAMRGPLMMGRIDFDPLSNKQITTDGDAESRTSFPVYFGNKQAKLYRLTNDFIVSNQEADLYLNSSNTNHITGNTISLIASTKAQINFEAFEVDVAGINQEIAITHSVDANGVLLGGETHQSNDKDLLTTDVKAHRKKLHKNKIHLTLNIGREFFYPENAAHTYVENGVTYNYVDLFALIESLEINEVLTRSEASGVPIFLTEENLDPPLPDGTNNFVEMFWGDQGTDTFTKSFLIQETQFKLFCFSDKLNCKYDFQLYYASAPGSNPTRIFSPIYRIDDSGRGYRGFELHIDRGTCLNLNYDGFDPEYIYEHEYVVDIGMLSLGTGGNRATTWEGNILPYLVLNYNQNKVDSISKVHAELKTFLPSLDTELNLPNGIEKIFVTAEKFETNTFRIINGNIRVRLGANVLAENVPEGELGILDYDKLYIKERIENNNLFVDIKGFWKDNYNVDSEVEYYRFRNQELPGE